MKELNDLAKRCIKVCKKKKWRPHWTHGACYLHLEVSELIESIRGKGNNKPFEEAADVLFVFLSMCEEHNISLTAVIDHLNKQLEEYER